MHTQVIDQIADTPNLYMELPSVALNTCDPKLYPCIFLKRQFPGFNTNIDTTETSQIGCIDEHILVLQNYHINFS